MSRIGTTFRRIAPNWSARRISLLLTIVALVLWSYSMAQSRLNIGFWGIIESFPLTFFLSLAILTIASFILWVSPEKHEKLLFLQWCLLASALWLSPMVIGATGLAGARVPNAQLGNMEYIVRQGHVSPNITYHNWPATWIFLAALQQITGMGEPGLAIMNNITPFALQFLFLLPLYLFLRHMLPEDKRNYCWAGVWLFVLGNWVPQSYLGAQAFGYFLFLMALALLTKTSPWQRTPGAPGYGVGSMLALILVLALLPATHFFTSLIVLFIIIAIFAAKKAKTYLLPAIGSVFVAAWTIYGSLPFFRHKLPIFVSEAFRLDLIWRMTAPTYGVASESYQAVVQTRLLFGAIFLAIGVAGFLLGSWRKADRDFDLTALAIGAGTAALGVFMAAGYGGELVHRVFFFGLPVVAYFGVKLLNYKTTALLLCAVLVVLIPLHFISHWGNETSDHQSPGEIAGVYFFYDHTTRGLIITTSPSQEGMRNMEQYGLPGGVRYPNTDIVGYLETLTGPTYVAITKTARAKAIFTLNNPYYIGELQSDLDNSPNVNLIYVNPDFRQYKYETPD